MRLSARTFAIALLVLLGACSAAMSAETGKGGIRGVVADGSGGVLPGVTVVATSDDGQVLATAVTDTVGGYLLGALPAVRLKLTFQLEGFSTAVVEVAVRPDADSVVTQRLLLARVAEERAGVRDRRRPPRV